LECLADFEGAVAIESQLTETPNAYRLMEDFFEPSASERWFNSEDRAHKTFLVLAWLEYSRRTANHSSPLSLRS
jgi:hypothetical protein